MRYCCVPMCKSNSTKKVPGVSFHELPSNMEIRERWLSVIARKDWVPSPGGNSSLVCSKHFRSEDFKNNTKRRTLLPTAVPSVFADYPKYMQPKSPHKRSDSAIIKRAALQLIEVCNSARPTGSSTSQLFPQLKTELHLPDEWALNPDESVAIRQEPNHSMAVNVSCQVDFPKREIQIITKAWKRRLSSQKNQIERLKQQLKIMRHELSRRERKQKDVKQYVEVLNSGLEGDNRANILIDQVKNFRRKKPLWSEITIRNCELWYNCSSQGYNFARNTGMLKLPNRTTLQRHINDITILPEVEHSVDVCSMTAESEF